jgi:hypothetical protein
MPSRLEGEAAISAINGRQIRKRTVNVIEALPLSREKGSTQKKRVNRYRGRERGK